jgi:3-dehydroquinate synthase
MERIRVDLPGREYDILVGSDLVSELAEFLKDGGWRKVALVSHPLVLKLHHVQIEALVKELKLAGISFRIILFPAGERYKNLNTVKRVYNELISSRFDRSDLLLAWGGGVVGDLTGFVAASIFRGVEYLQVPTTLMAMVDSSIGGKVGVDLPQGKNLVGFFYQPVGVFCDITLLRTLRKRELRSGLAEVAKYGLVFEPGLCDLLKKERKQLLKVDVDLLIRVVSRCARIKAHLVQEDERDEKDRRILLNYGHTLGHALESATGYRSLFHGEAVALGMRMAARLADLLQLGGEDLYSYQLELLRGLGLAGLVRHPVSVERVMEAVTHDKKLKGGKLRMVLLEEVGKPVIVQEIPPGALRRAVQEVLKEEEAWSKQRGEMR